MRRLSIYTFGALSNAQRCVVSDSTTMSRT